LLIVKNYWQLFSHIFGETLLIVTNIWRNRTCFFLIGAILCKLPLSPGGIFVNPVVSKPSYKHDLQEARDLHRVSLLSQFTGNRQRPRQQAEIIGRQGREKKRRHDQSASHSS
jgi:hypothetical protein